VLQRDRDLRCERLQPRLVFFRERASTLVENLRYADGLAVLIDDGHAENGPRKEACAPVEGRIEAEIGICMRNVHAVYGFENGSRDTDVIRKSDLRCAQPLPDFGIQLVGLFIIQEERGTL